MKFIIDGPDIPNELLQLHEDGNLVIFCGSGISVKAGLPLFKGLVDRIFEKLEIEKNDIETNAYDFYQYDRVLYLLEQRLSSKMKVRKITEDVLTIKKRKPLTTFDNLMKLSTDINGKIRLVTTNFDRGFEIVNSKKYRSKKYKIDSAPYLPIPNNNKWNSIVHLHGILTDREEDLDNLILTSADFGAAYLMDMWASRFVTELFKNFTVLFIGYKVEDSVIKYMMDALAAERSKFNKFYKNAYVLASDDSETNEKWKAQGIEPIFYNDKNNHFYLHNTLKAWAEIYTSRYSGKENIVRKIASHSPSNINDEEINQLLWALSDFTGNSAKIFADLPAPIEWLDILDENGLLALDNNKNGKISKIPIADYGQINSCPPDLSQITRILCSWLVNYLDSKKLIHWIIKKGICLHPTFKLIIRQHLRTNPYSRPIELIWNYWSSDNSTCDCNDTFFENNLQYNKNKFKWDINQKYHVLKLFSPILKFNKPWGYHVLENKYPGTDKVSDYLDVEFTTKISKHSYFLEQMKEWPEQYLFNILPSISNELLKGWELLDYFEQIDNKGDLSYMSLPSISDHNQNKYYDNWTLIVNFIRNIWDKAKNHKPELAREVLSKWMKIEYPLFKRLSLYGLANSDFFDVKTKVLFLQKEESWWLWSSETEREVYRLLAHLSGITNEDVEQNLFEVIHIGPPRKMYRDDLSDENWHKYKSYSIWKMIGKLNDYGWQMSDKLKDRYKEISDIYTDWELYHNDRDEFPSWTGEDVNAISTGSENYDLNNMSDEEIFKKLKEKKDNSRDNFWNAWRKCTNKNGRRIIEILKLLPLNEKWIKTAWEVSLENLALTSDIKKTYSYNNLGNVLLKIEELIFIDLIPYIMLWLEEIIKDIKGKHNPLFWNIWNHCLSRIKESDFEELSDPVGKALNNPAGRGANILLLDIWARDLKSGDGFPKDVIEKLNFVITSEHLVLSKVIIFSRLLYLYAIDPKWVRTHLISLLILDDRRLSVAYWHGFLWIPKLNPTFFSDIKQPFIEMILNRSLLNDSREKIVELFTILTLEHPDSFSKEEKRKIVEAVGKSGLGKITSVICNQMRQLHNKQGSEAYWKNRVKLFINDSFPQVKDVTNENISKSLAEIMIYSGKYFNSAVNIILDYLVPIKYHGPISRKLNNDDNIRKYPDSTLHLLARIIGEGVSDPDNQIREILNKIGENKPVLKKSSEYYKIDKFLLSNQM